jgi:DNA-binding response OmpR family regulator
VASAAEALRVLDERPLPIVVADLSMRDPASGRDDPEVGLRLIEGIAEVHQGPRVVVLSAHGCRDTLRARLFEAGVRTVDVIDKAAGRAECGAMLLASLQRAADEMWRGVRRARELSPGHHIVRPGLREILVDGRAIPLSPREACVLAELFRRPNQAVKAELIEAECFTSDRRSRARNGYNALNKVHLTVGRLRRKIDRQVGVPGVGSQVIRTPHRGARTAYELHGVVTDLAEPRADA